jgi:FPC/CPF motif-containing protein YcgG
MMPTLRFAEIQETFGYNSWQSMLAREFQTTLTSKSCPFPCVFGVWAFAADTLRFAFADPFDPESLARVLTDYLATARDIGPRTALVTFARPGAVRPIQHYRRRFQRLLDGLERIDSCPRPETIPREIDDPLWAFCFAGEGMFVSVATPANVLPQSRRASSLALVFQPRWIFEGIITGTGDRIHPAIDEIRKTSAGDDRTEPAAILEEVPRKVRRTKAYAQPAEDMAIIARFGEEIILGTQRIRDERVRKAVLNLLREIAAQP